MKLKGYIIGFVGVWGLGVGWNGEYFFFRYGFDLFYGVLLVYREYCMGNLRMNLELYYMWRFLCLIFSFLFFICLVVGFVVWYNGYILNMVMVLIVVVVFVFYSSIF